MRLRLFTDPHIGLNKTSHTTPASRQKLKEVVYRQARDIVSDKQQYAVCLGDLFDTFAVDNTALLQGVDILKGVAFNVFGNHDLVNRTDLISSVELLDKFMPNRAAVYRSPAGEPRASVTTLGCDIWFIDHKLNQDIFEGALEDALNRAVKGNILMLHCNYEFGHTLRHDTLNLTRDMAKRLLDKFSHIFIGHEHAPRADLNGRVIVLGNTHPTSFADISDKFIYDLEILNGIVVAIHPIKVWEKQVGYIQVPHKRLLELALFHDDHQFVDVVGDAEPDQMPAISKAISDLWHRYPNLLMVRNNVTVVHKDMEYGVSDDDEIRCMSIPDRISEQLADTPLNDVWKGYLNRI